MPYRVPADNDYPALEAEEFRRDLAAMRRTSMSDRGRIALLLAVGAVVAWIGYGTFHRHPDVDGASTSPPCRTAITITPLGSARSETYCGAYAR